MKESVSSNFLCATYKSVVGLHSLLFILKKVTRVLNKTHLPLVFFFGCDSRGSGEVEELRKRVVAHCL